MKALVVYESLWGNTAAVARAIAEGIGPEARALSTAEATPEILEGVDLLVAGCPVHAFRPPTDESRENIRRNPGKGGPPDLSHPALRSWLTSLPPGQGSAAAFDTQVRGPFGSAAPFVLKELERVGYRAVAKPVGFMLKGKYGPVRDSELERARAWGAELPSWPG